MALWGAKSDVCLHHVQLEKIYDPTREEDDMLQMEEDRLRMREHVMNEVGASSKGTECANDVISKMFHL